MQEAHGYSFECGEARAGSLTVALTSCYTDIVIGRRCRALFETCACALIREESEMSKLLSVMVASLFAVSAFAADAPKTATPETKPAAVAATPAKTETKVEAKTETKAAPAEVKKTGKHHKKHKGVVTSAANPALTPAPATPAK
jgi:hypothetical protein